jgi:hypothetical protein
MMHAGDSDGTNSNLDVQTVRAYLGATTGRTNDLPEVQVEALERAEASQEVEAGPPSVGALDSP